MYSTDVAQAYCQLPMDPEDLPLVCFNFDGSFFIDISLLFGLGCAQYVMSLVTRDLTRQGLSILNYIDDFDSPHLSYSCQPFQLEP